MLDAAVLATPDPGHALPAIGVAAALARRGADVRALTGEAHAATAAAHHVPFGRLPAYRPRSPGLGEALWSAAPAMARALADELRSARPRVLVVDSLLPAGGLAAQLLGVPWIEVIPHHLPDPAPDLPPVGLGRRRSRSRLRRLDDRLIHRAQQRSLQLGVRQAAEAAAALGWSSPTPPALRLLATLPGLERPRARWPDTAHVVGPLAVDPALPPLEPPPGDAPLVLVTDTTVDGPLGSIGEVALRALDHDPVRLVVTSGRLAAQRDARRVVGTGPHGPLLASAVLAVGPGGGGFIAKALAAGVPLVCVPRAGDQREAAARLRDVRVGRIVRPGALRPQLLRWAILRHLADRPARRAATELARQAASLGADLAAELVLEVAEGRVPTATGPRTHLASR